MIIHLGAVISSRVIATILRLHRTAEESSVDMIYILDKVNKAVERRLKSEIGSMSQSQEVCLELLLPKTGGQCAFVPTSHLDFLD